MKAFRLVITGNPGAGKHTSARLIADRLGAEIIDINEVALENDAVLSKTSHGADVDVKKLGKLLATALKKKDSFVIVGHLAPYVLKSAGIDMAAVLRRSPNKLESTLAERKYTREKINENVSAEILGVLLYDAIKAFGKRKVGEFDTTNRTPEETAGQIIAALQKKSAKRVGVVDWLAILSEEEVQKFFAY
ncbi:MAG: adenylate kinase family protein [Nitrososphaera sp.]|uniref:adenylate kinase family protein n=1 Tax=Nitrososphaera sp. TaxID=1971748 RepID=UPI003D6F7690